MIAANRIRWNKVVSNELNVPDLIMDAAFDSDSSETETYLNREAVSQESYDGRRNHVTSYKYNQRFSPRFTFVKKGFGDFSAVELRSVLKWLTSLDTPSILDVYGDDSNVIEFSAIGNWTEISSYKLANNRTVGVVATFEAVHSHALSDLYTVTKTIFSPDNNKITIEIDTDDNKPVYPRVIINHGYGTTPTPHTIVDITGAKPFSNVLDMVDYVDNTVYKNGTTYYWKTSEPTFMSATTAPKYEGWTTVAVTRAYTSEDTFENNTFYKYNNTYYWFDPYAFHSSSTPPSLDKTSVKLTNTHTDFFNQSTVLPSTIVKNNNSTEVITLDGANKIISSSSTRRIFDNDFENWQWLELHDGKNEIEILGNCEVTITYRTVVKCGEF